MDDAYAGDKAQPLANALTIWQNYRLLNISIISKSLMIAPDAAPKPTRNEGLKTHDPLLAGTIRQTLDDPAKDRFSEDDYEFLKFHGIYQQDDRDHRKLGKQFIF